MANPPSKPMNINSPRETPDEFLSASAASGRPGSMPGPGFGTPSSRPARQGTPSTPPIANIPLRGAEGGGLPASFSARSARPHTPHSGGSTTPPLGDNPNRPFLDDVTEEEMARVLRRHLVPRRAPEVNVDAGASDPAVEEMPSGSRRASGSGSQASVPNPQVTSGNQEEDEPFPIPYDAPGGDITWALSFSGNSAHG